jgi:hypothetical protein
MNGLPGSPENVRIATRDDEAALFDLLLALHKDNGFGISPRAQDLRETIRAGTRETNGTLIGVIDGDEGEIAGAFYVHPAKWWYNKSPEAFYLNELFLFVRPEYRKRGRYWNDLFRSMVAYKELTDASMGTDVPLVTSVSSLHRLPAKMRLWSRYAKLVGGIYVIERKAAMQTAADLAA